MSRRKRRAIRAQAAIERLIVAHGIGDGWVSVDGARRQLRVRPVDAYRLARELGGRAGERLRAVVDGRSWWAGALLMDAPGQDRAYRIEAGDAETFAVALPQLCLLVPLVRERFAAREETRLPDLLRLVPLVREFPWPWRP
jgi:hypothetical protein